MDDFIEAADRSAVAPVAQNAIYFAEVGDVDKLRDVLKANPDLVHTSKDWVLTFSSSSPISCNFNCSSALTTGWRWTPFFGCLA